MPRITICKQAGAIEVLTEVAGRVEDVADLLILLGEAKPPVIEQTIEVVVNTDPLEQLLRDIDAQQQGSTAAFDLLYLSDNSALPVGRVSSTARKGRKWYDQVEVGDRVNLKVTDGDKFGEAVIVYKELMPYAAVLENADHNHVAFCGKVSPLGARGVLADELFNAYGPSSLDDEFTVLHILLVNQSLDN